MCRAFTRNRAIGAVAAWSAAEPAVARAFLNFAGAVALSISMGTATLKVILAAFAGVLESAMGGFCALLLVAHVLSAAAAHSGRGFIGRLLALVGRAGVLAIISAEWLALVDAFGVPRHIVMWSGWDAVVAEVLGNGHNVAALALAPTAVLLLVFSDADWVWLGACVATAIATVANPMTCVVDDLLVKTVLGNYMIIMASGFVLCSGSAAWLATPVAAFVLAVALYFYAAPIPGGGQAAGS